MGGGLLLYVSVPPEGRRIALELDPSATVDDLRAAVRETAGSDLELNWQGSELRKGTESLADLGICPQSVVEGVMKTSLQWEHLHPKLEVTETKWPRDTVTDNGRCSGLAIASQGFERGRHKWKVSVLSCTTDQCWDMGVCTQALRDRFVAGTPPEPTSGHHAEEGVWCIRAFAGYKNENGANSGATTSGGAMGDGWPGGIPGVAYVLELDCGTKELFITPDVRECETHRELGEERQLLSDTLPAGMLYPMVGLQSCKAVLRIEYLGAC
eukprot:Hpha_TRINITY_DN14844_c0_g2::TRINITY_DN14844_c0_g2_i1::g.169306::m.169306